MGDVVAGETRFAYIPATAVNDGTVSVQAAADPTLTQAGGESSASRTEFGMKLSAVH